ncbi:MAG: thioredoxin domain-containing protein [Bacteroidia bacterium]
MNELINETSPYLLQHAGNPIHWKAWKPEILQQAKNEDKLIILSVGYSACHWCHVMEHESFEDQEVAALMNAHFISIKVDREERPDVDATYMKAVQIMTGQGGWPMNVVLLPDGRAVWGGTYFRKNQWMETLDQLQEMYRDERSTMEDYAIRLLDGVKQLSLLPPNEEEGLKDPSHIKPLVEKWARSFDWDFGGYARAPKFMMPNNYLFLQRYGYQTKTKELLDFVDLTLTRMAWGGLFDTAGGGFSRYSIDMHWHVPHFEKMLYDNGQLMSLYTEAYKRTQNPLYKEVIEKTHFFVKTELTTTEGAFYSAWDADSLNFVGHKEEGAFYTWEEHELKTLLGDDFPLFQKVFNINEFGFWEDGRFVLIQTEPLDKLADSFGISQSTLSEKKKHWEQMLYTEREKRHKPGLDDKVLTSWNALMLKGYADAYKATTDDTYLNAALSNANFIINKLWDENGHLWRTYKNGEARINGFLEDYVHTADAFISLYQATLDEQWLQYAKNMNDYALEHFYDEDKQFFLFNQRGQETLVAPHYETEDNVIPAANSVMANVLYKLSLYFDNAHYEKVALQMLYNIIPAMDYPSAFSNWLNLWLDLGADNRELAVCGIGADYAVKKINTVYLPHILLAGSEKDSVVPLLKNRFAENRLLFYVCQNKACGLPKENLEETLNDIKL